MGTVDTTQAVVNTIDWAVIIKYVMMIWASATGNPVTAFLGMLGTTVIGALVTLYLKGWAKKQVKEAAKVVEVKEREDFIDREAPKTEERNDKDNAGRDALRDLP